MKEAARKIVLLKEWCRIFLFESKVLAKIRAFPYWPAVIEAISDDGIITVKFPDGKLGMNATVVALTPESMKKQLETGKFKIGKVHIRGRLS